MSSVYENINIHVHLFFPPFRCHGDGGRRKFQPGSETAVLSGQSLRQEEQHPHHGRGHGVHRHGNGQCVCVCVCVRAQEQRQVVEEHLEEISEKGKGENRHGEGN